MPNSSLQSSFPFPVDADPRFCALREHRIARIRPSRVLILDGYEFKVCRSCACNYEGRFGAKVEKIAGEVTNV